MQGALSRLYGFFLISLMIGVIIFLAGLETSSVETYQNRKVCSLSMSEGPGLVSISRAGTYKIYWESTATPIVYRTRRSRQRLKCDRVVLRHQKTNQILSASAPWYSVFGGQVSEIGQVYISAPGQYSIQSYPSTARGNVVLAMP